MSWDVGIYFDYLDDTHCNYIIYKFERKELAYLFQSIISKEKPYLVLEEPIENFFTYSDNPIQFSNINDALCDIESFITRKNYKYKDKVEEKLLNEMELIYLRQENMKLYYKLQELLNK